MIPLFKRYFLILFSICLILACDKQQVAKPGSKPIPVNIIELEPETVPAIFEYVGVAESSHLVEIRARVEGYLQKIAYPEGGFVREGDLLFELDPAPYEAKLDEVKATLSKIEAELWNAKTTVERLKPLYEQKAASKRDLDNAVSQQLSLEAQVLSGKAQIRQAELNLSYTVIKAPVSALTGASKYREGALITPGAEGLMTTLSVVDPIWVNFSVSESDILRYQKEVKEKRLRLPKDLNFDVRIRLSDGTMYNDVGRVNFTDPTLNQGTGTMNVRTQFPNGTTLIKPGQFVKIYVVGAVYPNAILIPQKAVQENRKGMFVYIVNKNNQVELRLIEPGKWMGSSWLIRSGLAIGDRVIIDGVNKVQPGAPVNPTVIPFKYGDLSLEGIFSTPSLTIPKDQ